MRKFYDFKCDSCGNMWEEFIDPPYEDRHLMCLECHSTKVRRLISAPFVGGETPYKTLDKHGVPGTKVVSGPHYRSK